MSAAVGRRKKPFVVLELTETEARALLHCVELALVVSGKGKERRGDSVRLGARMWPHTDGEVAAVHRVAKKTSPLFKGGCWFARLASEVDADEVVGVDGGGAS